MLKKTIVALLAVLSATILTGSQVVFADTPTDQIFQITYGDYQDENVYYHLDYIDPTELEDEGFWDKFNVFGNLKDGVVGFFYNLLHQIFVALPFFMLKTATTAMIWLFNKVYEVNFVNAIVGEITSSIQSIAGISGTSFGTSGLFGGFLGIVTLSVALYTLYQFIVKKASISAFSGLLKSLVALVLALVFFSNYSTIINGLNTLSVEASSMIVSGSITVNDDGNITNQSAQEEMNTALWNTFVYQPYLMLQYGTMDEDSIGQERINELLTKKPDTEERYNVVKEEILDQGNEMMSREKIFERWGILAIASMANIFNAIPVMILVFALIFFQFWFTAMAMIAPFVFIWSAFPNQFGVLARYLLELITPLILKIAVSVLALIVFSLTSILASVAMNTLNTSGYLSYIFLVFMEGILFFTLFLLRKRILNIFSMGSKQLEYVREGMSNTFVQPAKKGIQGTTTAVGTVAGAMVGGAQGAMVGSSIGHSVGQTMTGDKGIGDAGRDTALNYSLYENMQNRKAMEEQAMEEQAMEEQREQQMVEQQERDQQRQAQEEQKMQEQEQRQVEKEGRLDNITSELKDSGLSEETIAEAHEELEKRGITDVNSDEIKSAYDYVKSQAETGKLKKPFAKAFANKISNDRFNNKLQDEKAMLSKASDIETGDIESGDIKTPNDNETLHGKGNKPNEDVSEGVPLDNLDDVIDKDNDAFNHGQEKFTETPDEVDKYELGDLIDGEKQNVDESDNEGEAL